MRFENAKDGKDLLLRLSPVVDGAIVFGKTRIFLDEVQERKEIVTDIKLLVEEGHYRCILKNHATARRADFC